MLQPSVQTNPASRRPTALAHFCAQIKPSPATPRPPGRPLGRTAALPPAPTPSRAPASSQRCQTATPQTGLLQASISAPPPAQRAREPDVTSAASPDAPPPPRVRAVRPCQGPGPKGLARQRQPSRRRGAGEPDGNGARDAAAAAPPPQRRRGRHGVAGLASGMGMAKPSGRHGSHRARTTAAAATSTAADTPAQSRRLCAHGVKWLVHAEEARKTRAREERLGRFERASGSEWVGARTARRSGRGGERECPQQMGARAGSWVGEAGRRASRCAETKSGKTDSRRKDGQHGDIFQTHRQPCHRTSTDGQKGRQGRRERVSRAQRGGRDPRGREARAGPGGK